MPILGSLCGPLSPGWSGVRGGLSRLLFMPLHSPHPLLPIPHFPPKPRSLSATSPLKPQVILRLSPTESETPDQMLPTKGRVSAEGTHTRSHHMVTRTWSPMHTITRMHNCTQSRSHERTITHVHSHTSARSDTTYTGSVPGADLSLTRTSALVHPHPGKPSGRTS